MNTRDDQVSPWTLAALGFLAYYITVMWHEIIGHGATLYLLGARQFILTSTSMHSPDVELWGPHITAGARFVLVSGALSNIALGLILYPVFRALTRRNASFTARYLLWLLVALNFYLAFIYPVFSGIFAVADFAGAIVSLPHHALLRVLEVLGGALLCFATVRFFAVSFADFPENRWRLALIPYFSASLVFCLAGMLNPAGPGMMLMSVLPAALMGQSILLFVTPLARKLRRSSPSTPALEEAAATPTVIFIASLLVVVIFLTAPGVRFTVP
jgi:hypothetical protein